MHLTEETIAIELPEDAVAPFIGCKVSDDKYLFYVLPDGMNSVVLGSDNYTLIGVTPLSYETWCTDVFSSEYERGEIRHGSDIGAILEDLGFSNKKLAIIKIQKK